jgi:hypothetical protein
MRTIDVRNRIGGADRSSGPCPEVPDRGMAGARRVCGNHAIPGELPRCTIPMEPPCFECFAPAPDNPLLAASTALANFTCSGSSRSANADGTVQFVVMHGPSARTASISGWARCSYLGHGTNIKLSFPPTCRARIRRGAGC